MVRRAWDWPLKPAVPAAETGRRLLPGPDAVPAVCAGAILDSLTDTGGPRSSAAEHIVWGSPEVNRCADRGFRSAAPLECGSAAPALWKARSMATKDHQMSASAAHGISSFAGVLLILAGVFQASKRCRRSCTISISWWHRDTSTAST